MTKQKVKTFDLSDSQGRLSYEALMNDPNVTVVREQFAYTGREGIPKITVFYIIEE